MGSSSTILLFLFVLLDSFCVILPVSIISISPDWLTSVWLTLALATHQRGLGEHHTSLILQKKVNLVTCFHVLNIPPCFSEREYQCCQFEDIPINPVS